MRGRIGGARVIVRVLRRGATGFPGRTLGEPLDDALSRLRTTADPGELDAAGRPAPAA
jgi:hypothetical protein